MSGPPSSPTSKEALTEGAPYAISIKFDISSPSPISRIQQFFHNYKNSINPSYAGFDALLMRSLLHVTSATATPTPTANFSLKLVPELCNPMNRMHGGAVSLVFDMCTTMAVAPLARKGFWEFGGVTRSLNVTILRPGLLGEEVIIECEVVQAGSRLATIRGTMRRKKDGAVLSICEHGKASLDVPAQAQKL